MMLETMILKRGVENFIKRRVLTKIEETLHTREEDLLLMSNHIFFEFVGNSFF